MEASALQAPAGLNRISVTAPLLRLRSDEQLVALFRAGNDAAFSVIHDRYRQRLFAYSRQMLGGLAPGRRGRAAGRLPARLRRAARQRPAAVAARLAVPRRAQPLHRPAAPRHARAGRRARHRRARRCTTRSPRPSAARTCAGSSTTSAACPSSSAPRCSCARWRALLRRARRGALGVTVPAVKSLLVRARIGLVEAVEARDTACGEIRVDLASAHERGVRASGLARRHMRDCAGCREYRHQLRVARRSFAALSPAAPGPLAALLQLIGLGGAARAPRRAPERRGGRGRRRLRGHVIAGAGTATKVAAIVCGAAITAGGAVEVHHRVVDTPAPAPAAQTAAPAQSARARRRVPQPRRRPGARATTHEGLRRRRGARTRRRRRARAQAARRATRRSRRTSTTPPSLAGRASRRSSPTPPDARGGVAAPDEEAAGAALTEQRTAPERAGARSGATRPTPAAQAPGRRRPRAGQHRPAGGGRGRGHPGRGPRRPPRPQSAP